MFDMATITFMQYAKAINAYPNSRGEPKETKELENMHAPNYRNMNNTTHAIMQLIGLPTNYDTLINLKTCSLNTYSTK